MAHKINKQWFVIYDGANIIQSGDRTGLAIYSNSDYAEFDTEQELLEYIAEHGLVYPEEIE
jgi:hypothetical protein